jgi:hypothetical protein
MDKVHKPSDSVLQYHERQDFLYLAMISLVIIQFRDFISLQFINGPIIRQLNAWAAGRIMRPLSIYNRINTSQ